MRDNLPVRRLILVAVVSLMSLNACTETTSRIEEPDDTTPPDWVVETTDEPPDLAAPATVPEPLTEDGVSFLLTSYLPDHLLAAEFGGEIFCAYEMYGWEQDTDTAAAWLWAQCEEYYLDAGELQTGSGVSTPVTIHMSKLPAGWLVSFAEEAGLGSLNTDSVREMFPPEFANRALSHDSSRDLSAEIEHAARSRLAS
jgi:hypothetical protein